MSQVRFQSLIDSLGLSVRLRMERGRHGQLRTQKLRDSFPKRTREPSVTIRDKFAAKTMQPENIVHVQRREILRAQRLLASHEMNHFRQLIHKDTDRVMPSFSIRKLDNKIEGHSMFWLLWNFQRLECAVRPVATSLVTLAHSTRRNKQ